MTTPLVLAVGPASPIAVGGPGALRVPPQGSCSLLVQLRRPRPEHQMDLGCGQGLRQAARLCEVSAVPPARGCRGWSLPLGRPALFTGSPVVLCVPPTPPTQVWPPGEWKGECGTATEPADSGGIARGVR